MKDIHVLITIERQVLKAVNYAVSGKLYLIYRVRLCNYDLVISNNQFTKL